MRCLRYNQTGGNVRFFFFLNTVPSSFSGLTNRTVSAELCPPHSRLRGKAQMGAGRPLGLGAGPCHLRSNECVAGKLGMLRTAEEVSSDSASIPESVIHATCWAEGVPGNPRVSDAASFVAAPGSL